MQLVQLSSKTMNTEEKNYSTFEREAFGVIFKLEKFRVYSLSSLTFFVVTDNMAFKFTLQRKDIHEGLETWL